MKTALLVMLLGVAADAAAQPLAPGWAATPAEVARFLEGGDPRQDDGRLWFSSASGAVWGVAALPRLSIGLGRGAMGVVWRRTGRAEGVWHDDHLGITVPLPGPSGTLEMSGGTAGPQGERWPAGGWLAWRSILDFPGGWRLGGRLVLASVPRPWLERPGPLLELRRWADPWLVSGAWGRDRDGRAGMDVSLVRRFGDTVALESSRTADGAPGWALLVRRGPLQVRAAQGWHDLLGVWRTWEVSLCGPGR